MKALLVATTAILSFLPFFELLALESHPPVYFKFNSYTPSKSQIILNQRPKIDKVDKVDKVDEYFLIKGYTDGVGSIEYNLILSCKRAHAVKSGLIEKYELNPERIKVNFYGIDHSKNIPNSKKRRAEILSGTADEISALQIFNENTTTNIRACPTIERHSPVYFGFDSHQANESQIILNHLPKENEIFWFRGYSDIIGEEEYNLALSRERMKTVESLLTQKYKLEPERVKKDFYGMDFSSGIPNSGKRRTEILSGKASVISALRNAERIEEKAPEDELAEQPETKTKKEPFKWIGRYNFGPGIYQDYLVATDKETNAKAEWVSENNFLLQGKYQIKLGKFWAGLEASYHFKKYEVELNPSYTWDENVPNLLKFSLVGDYESNRWGIELGLGYGELLAIYENNFNIKLEKLSKFEASIRGKYKFFQTGQWSSRVGLGLHRPLQISSDINSKGSLGYIGFVDLKRAKLLRDHGLKAQIYYGVDNHTNNQNDQEEEFIGFTILMESENWL